ncbi:MAG: cytochrome c biogenesis protein CcsA [Phycisphaeraceae bacterium]
MSRTLIRLYWLLTAALFAGGIAMLIAWTPTEVTMGPVQKIFYIHLPAAICTFFACLLTFIASIGYLLQRQRRWDDLASASASVAVVLASVVLITGIIWGKSAWGQWWTWSPRLTFSLILWLLYVVYLLIRPSIAGSQRRAVVSAVYGVIAFLDVPLVYLSVRLMPDIHPSSIQLAPAMQWTLAYWFLPVTMLAVGLVVAQYRLQRRATLHSAAHLSDYTATGAAPAGIV